MPSTSPSKKRRGMEATYGGNSTEKSTADTPAPSHAAVVADKQAAVQAPSSPSSVDHASDKSASSTASPSDSSRMTPRSLDASSKDRLRIQAPTSTTSGQSSRSPASAFSAPTSPADDGLETPDGSESSITKRKRGVDDAGATTAPSPPLFLEKTYEMLDKSAPDVACWSAGGDSFIVKNPSAFAEHVIPIYFKHKNFSSFVRQLNFYGFRKVRVVDPEVTGGVDPKDWWEFRHDKFVRGRKELLKDIKRRTHFGGNAGAETAARASIDRAEIDELRTEVSSLREQIQTLNKHMYSVMQIMMMRNAAGVTPGPNPGAYATHALVSPHHLAPPPPPHHQVVYAVQHGRPPSHPAPLPTPSTKSEPRGLASATTSNGMPVSMPTGAFALRPLQSIVGAAPHGYVAHPPTPSGDRSSVDWETFTRIAYNYHAAHASQGFPTASQPQHTATTSTPAAGGSSVPPATGLKRSRSKTRSPSKASTTSASTTTAPVVGVAAVDFSNNPEAVVRHMSYMVSQIRDDLLQHIIARTLTFVRVQPSNRAVGELSDEIEAVCETILGDIQQKLVDINDAEAATQGKPPGGPPSETSHMYRVEILKFVSKELARAMAEAVEKRLPPATKKSLNRSLLALMVQKAQASLENQMRVENANSPGGTNTTNNTSSSTGTASGR